MSGDASLKFPRIRRAHVLKLTSLGSMAAFCREHDGTNKDACLDVFRLDMGSRIHALAHVVRDCTIEPHTARISTPHCCKGRSQTQKRPAKSPNWTFEYRG